MTDINIPAAVVEAAKRAWANGTGPTSADDWKAAFIVGMRAWPGFSRAGYAGENCIILPLPQEAHDE